MTGGLDFAGIRRLLPHGYPMVLLDRVDDLEPGVSIRAVKAVSGAESCYAGLDGTACHAYPTSLLLESFGQAAAILWLAGTSAVGEQDVLMFAAARDCEFSGHAYPGDTLCHTARLEHRTDGVAFVSGQTAIGSRRIASIGSMLAVVRPQSALAAPPADRTATKGVPTHG